MDFDAKNELLTTRSVFFKYLRKNGNEMKLFTDFNKAYVSVICVVLYNFLIDLSIPMKLIKLIKMYLDETYNGVRAGKICLTYILLRII